jgi:hypothetical protein
MGLKDWFASRVGGAGEARIRAEYEGRITDMERRLEEAVRAAGAPSYSSAPYEGVRRLTDPVRDLPATTHARMIEAALYLHGRNPLAGALIERPAEWMVGEGATIEAEEPRTKQVLDEWWKANKMETELISFVRELSIFGEDMATVNANPYSGIIRMGVMDPGSVREVIPDPENAAVPIGVIRKPTAYVGEKRYQVVLSPEDEEALSLAAVAERERMQDGEVFYAGINKLRRQTRGTSDLFRVADWLDGYEQFLFYALVRERALSNYTWDYKFEGWDETRIADYMNKLQAPRPFSNWGHNEKMSRELVGPREGSAHNNSEHASLFRNQITSAAAMGEHMFGGGGDVNRSTSDSMDGHTIKSFTARQAERLAILRSRAAAQIERAIQVRRLRDTPGARSFTMSLPDLSTRDVSRIASGLQSVANAGAMLLREGVLDKQTLGRMVASLALHVGVKVDDVGAMLDRAAEERADTLADQVARSYDGRLRERETARAA